MRTWMILLALAALMLSGCPTDPDDDDVSTDDDSADDDDATGDDDSAGDDDTDAPVDADEDGYPEDNDCDGVIPADEADDDADGWSVCASDCDDGDAAVHPGATEDCANGIDDDCDGDIDGDDPGCGAVDLEDGLIAWWRFDEGTGTTTADDSGHGHDADLQSLGWTTGYLGSAPDFDGNGYVIGPDIDEIASTDELTVMAWVNLYATDRTEILCSQWTDGTVDGAFEFTFESSPGFMFQTSSTGSDNYVARATTYPVPGVWYHLAGVHAGTTNYIYIDGVLEGTETAAAGIHDSSWRVFVGWKDDSWANHYIWRGDIDEVRIYNRALNDLEITAARDWAGP